MSVSCVIAVGSATSRSAWVRRIPFGVVFTTFRDGFMRVLLGIVFPFVLGVGVSIRHKKTHARTTWAYRCPSPRER